MMGKKKNMLNDDCDYDIDITNYYLGRKIKLPHNQYYLKL